MIVSTRVTRAGNSFMNVFAELIGTRSGLGLATPRVFAEGR